VTFDLVRHLKPEPDTITLTRAAVTPPALFQQQYENSSILYLKPVVLTKDRVDEMVARLHEMPKEGNHKVLLDLRDVAEGDPQQGIRLANAFLQTGTIATLQGQTVPTQTFTAESSKFISSAPLVVLVNHGTAGAAELVAAAILDNKRGDLVGDRTFGEGGEQKTFTLPDGSALMLTIAKYESPSGKKIEDDAVTPNIAVNPGVEEAPSGDENNPQEPKTDDQLNRALQILKQKNA
jgi:carboxyl-terminal processing protease